MIMKNIQRFLSSRQLHNIISKETIRPSSPTPPHLKTHNLSLVDQVAPNVNIPLIFFYKNYNKGDINTLKNSLSHTLTSYYPFAGRFMGPSVPQIDCNDQGVEFLEASNDNRLSDIIHHKEMDETIDELIPNHALSDHPHLIEVQLNHLRCGGAAVAVSLSHKVGDGFTLAKFINHWATVTRGGSSKNPTFLSSNTNNIKVLELDFQATDKVKYVAKRFVFSNTKINELKNKVNVLVDPTRVEILSSLIFKSQVGATTTLSGSLQPSSMYHVVNMRNKIVERNRPKIAAGNICTLVVVKIADSGEITSDEVIAKLRGELKGIKEVRGVEEVGEVLVNKMATVDDDRSRMYTFSSVCRFPFYEVDFGWGKPVQFMVKNRVLGGNVTHLMDTPSGDGIEATVLLGEKEMAIFQDDKDIVAYSQDYV